MILKMMMLASASAAAQTAVPLIVTPLDPVPQPMVVEIERDPITDVVSAFAVARSPDGRLAIGCDPDRFRGVRVTFRSQDWLAAENYLTGNKVMPYRFDTRLPVRGRWEIKDDVATLTPSTYVPRFVNRLAASERLTIRTRDIEDREKDLYFSLAGARPAIEQMLRLCAQPPRRDILRDLFRF